MIWPLVALTLPSFAVLVRHILKKRSAVRKHYAPIVDISAEDMFHNPRAAYEKALKDHGPVIGVRRKGRLEYIVDEELSHTILTSDSILSFEEGAATILNFHYVLHYFESFFGDLDDLVRNVIAARLPQIVENVFPVFANHVKDYMNLPLEPTKNNQAKIFNNAHEVDICTLASKSISESMVLTILGPKFVNEKNLDIVRHVAEELAVAGGMYTNTSLIGRTFPGTWRMFTWTRVLFTSIRLFCLAIGPQVWKELRLYRHMFENKAQFEGELEQNENILLFLTRKNMRQEHSSGKRTSDLALFLRVMIVILGLEMFSDFTDSHSIIFASIHQTSSIVVWIVFEIACRPEYLPSLREELFRNANIDPIDNSPMATYQALQDAEHLDSFIREVLRTKGDTLSLCRKSTQDVTIGGCIIPKGYLVMPLATRSHLSPKYHGPDASEFNGTRWVSTDKRAVKLSASYFPFGLGRWACPGRTLAVAEIKMIVWSIICQATPVLKGNSYRITDPLNITSVPPVGEMSFIPFSG
ncbi:cytochrome P450 [Phellopilus nigrolimitatus]|nr:cytochrome P450 [Phellopilus nigrolimitatus]